MTLDMRETTKIVGAEGLDRWAVFGKPANDVEKIAVWQENNLWHVAVTGERAGIDVHRSFANESDALDVFLQKLRLKKELDGITARW